MALLAIRISQTEDENDFELTDESPEGNTALSILSEPSHAEQIAATKGCEIQETWFYTRTERKFVTTFAFDHKLTYQQRDALFAKIRGLFDSGLLTEIAAVTIPYMKTLLETRYETTYDPAGFQEGAGLSDAKAPPLKVHYQEFRAPLVDSSLMSRIKQRMKLFGSSTPPKPTAYLDFDLESVEDLTITRPTN